MTDFTLRFNQFDSRDLAKVGGKNASLGELYQKLKPMGINIPDGFAVTVDSYWDFLYHNEIKDELGQVLSELDTTTFNNLKKVGEKARGIIRNGTFPEHVEQSILDAYRSFLQKYELHIDVAVRSSATAEDLPTASFAGQQESFLNISNELELLEACHQCYVSLFTDRAIKYREDNGFDHMSVALSIGVQRMVRSDLSCSGVMFTIEPDTGFKDVIVINSSWGLGDNIVQGTVTPDEYIIFKPSLKRDKKCIITKTLGDKEKTMVYAENLDHQPFVKTANMDTPKNKQEQFTLIDEEVKLLSKWAVIIEGHYKVPMDIEWAKDGITKEFYIVQARPETIHSVEKKPYLIHRHLLKEKGELLCKGTGLGNKVASGKVRILNSPKDSDKLQEGEVLVTDITNPDWDVVMKKASAIITNKGGRTSHAAIVARELGIVAIVGTGNATEILKNNQVVTVSCAEGNKGEVYNGVLKWETETIDTRKIKLPKTETMLILADPGKAFQLSFLPNNGIGLMRMEFVISNVIKIHPMALVKFDELSDNKAKQEIQKLTKHYPNKEDYFIDLLSQAVATVAAAFYPKDVVVRMSDFKTNEYANLVGGAQFEPKEENPMLGFRGASRYYSPLYKEGFKLECEAMKIVRDEMGFTNVKLMIPFCRTVEEGEKVTDIMSSFGLTRGVNDLEIYTMIEIPSNVILADQFAKVFDGFSIGSNDLTQLSLGLDRDSSLVSELFDENNEAIKRLITQVIESAHKTKTKIGLCGQAPSDFPEFSQFLVDKGINSVSFNPDALIKGIVNMNKAEEKQKKVKQGKSLKTEIIQTKKKQKSKKVKQ